MKYVKSLKEVFLAWIPLAVIVTMLSGMIFVVVQQSFRLSANDPQVQLIQDLTNELNNGQDIEQLDDSVKVQVDKSLSPFVIVYDNTGKELKSSVTLDSVSPTLPNGVLDNVKSKGYSQFTWAPKKGVRIATIGMKYKDGVIIVGKSLNEVDKRIDRIGKIVLIGWAATLIVLFVVITILKKNIRPSLIKRIFSKKK